MDEYRVRYYRSKGESYIPLITDAASAPRWIRATATTCGIGHEVVMSAGIAASS
jgi:hypothetical protein